MFGTTFEYCLDFAGHSFEIRAGTQGMPLKLQTGTL